MAGRVGDLINNNFIVAPYSYLPGYDFLQGSAIFNGGYVIGVRPRGLPITTLSWVNNVYTNVGIDFGLFNGRLSGTFDVFERKRTGCLRRSMTCCSPAKWVTRCQTPT